MRDLPETPVRMTRKAPPVRAGLRLQTFSTHGSSGIRQVRNMIRCSAQGWDLKMRWLWAAWLSVWLVSGCMNTRGTGDAGVGIGEDPAAPVREEAPDALPLQVPHGGRRGDPGAAPEEQSQAPKEPPEQAAQPRTHDEPSSAHDEQPPADRSPYIVPDGYRVVEADRFTFAVPDDWQVGEKQQDEFTFRVDGEKVGETEILGWFDADSWPDFKPNHSEQTGFEEREDLTAGRNGSIRIYRIELIHTKPAADRDPEWRYEEIRWYVADRDDGRAYGFCFADGKVDEAVMETIVSSFRLREAKDGK